MTNNKLQSFISRVFSGPWLFKKKTDPVDSQYEKLKSDETSEAENDIPVVVTIDDILDDIGLASFHVKFFFLLGCINLLDALEISMISIVSPVVKSEWNLSIWEEAMVPLVATCGMIIGSSIFGWICDQYGRKRAFLASSACILCFGLASFLAVNYYLLLLFLFLTGFGLATVTQVITMTEEFFPKLYRTKFSLLTCLFWTLGFFISAIAGEYIDVLGFRAALALVCIPTAIFLIVGMPFLPESPRYSLASGDNEKALIILQQIAPKNMAAKFQNWRLYKNVDVPLQRGNVVELFRHGYGKITCCLWLLWFVSSLSYYFIIFSTTELATNKISLNSEQTELKTTNYYFTLAWICLPEIFLILFTTFGSHFFGIKTLMLVNTMIAALLQAIVLLVGFNYKTTAVILLGLSRGFMESQITLTLIYTSEVYPTAIRGVGMGISFSVGRTGLIVGPFIAQTLFQNTHFIGALVNFCSLVLALVAIACLPFRSKNQMLE